ncbi:MAG: tetratricopeptide repeat protein [Armatimonadetes bacterium]|nr:tetratricopeptide repeat protein [Armatimonadota bacterium]
MITFCLFSFPVNATAQSEPKRLLQNAYSALRKGDIERARLLFETVIEIYPSSPEAAESQFRLGQIQRTNLFLDEAIACFQKVIGHPHAHPRLIALAKLSVGFVGIQKFTVGRWKVLNRNGDEGWKVLEGKAFWQVLEETQRYLEGIAREYSGQDTSITAAAKLAIAKVWLLRQIPRLAERTYWEVVKKWGRGEPVLTSLAYYGIAVAKAKQGNYEEAIETFDAFIRGFQVGSALNGLLVLSEDWKLKARTWKAFLLIGTGQRGQAFSELQLAEREGKDMAKRLRGATKDQVRNWIAKVRMWQANLLDETDRREEAERLLIETFTEFGDTPEGLKALTMLWGLPERRR